jgi:hypothetical protein
LDLKTVSYGLVIWASKSLRWFLGLGLKTKRAIVCRLCHKTDGRMKMAWDTCQDLAACFACKQVKLGFLSLTSRLAEVWHGWSTWHHRGGRVELELKMDGSMCIRLFYPNFAIFVILSHKGSLVIYFPINSVIEPPRGVVRRQDQLE